MEVVSKIHLVIDGVGDQYYGVCEDGYDTIQINATNKDNKTVHFESNANHLKKWCEENGFQYKCIEKKFDFDKLWEM